MIKFFRRIRQKLIIEGRLSKPTSPIGRYLIYAIGEIFLVVIGILIALQINNWNQNKIDQRTEKAYYMRFLEDVSLDEKLVSDQIEETKSRLSSANRLIHLLQNNQDDMETISKAIVGSVSRANYELKPIMTAYEDIKSSGNVHLIRDLDLKRSLDDYYASAGGVMNTININAHRLGAKMFDKELMISTGFIVELANNQDGFDKEQIDVDQLKSYGKLTDETKLILLNDGVVYVALTSRNIQHLKGLNQLIVNMKKRLEEKCQLD